MKTLGVITLSGDPITKGHLWMADEALRYFNHVQFLIGNNTEKKYLFTMEERVWLAEISVMEYFRAPLVNRVGVRSHETDDYIAFDLQDRYNDGYDEVSLVRGLRNGRDLEYEREILTANRKVVPDIGTVFIMPPAEVQMISSSIVKAQYKLNSWHTVADDYVTPTVREALKRKAESC